MPQGLGKTSIRRSPSSRTSTSSAACSASPRGAARAHRPPARATGLGPFPDRPAGKLSGGMKQKLGAVLRPDPRSRPADPRRADHRRRSAVAPAVLGADRRHPGRAAGHERGGRHRLHGRGRAVRLAGGHGRRPVLATGTAEELGTTGRSDAGGGLHRAAAGGEARPPAARHPADGRPTARRPSRPRA